MIYLKKTLTEQQDTRLPKEDMSGILLRDVRWSVKTAGPSPFDNERTELFLLGCNKAMSGDPCKGCFNSTTWDKSKALWSHDPIKMAKHINNNAPNKYITIGGGEPTDQIENLIILCKELKETYGFHILIYTWKELKNIMKSPYTSSLDADFGNPIISSLKFPSYFRELLKYIDIVVDGQYKEEERLWDGKKADGLISSIGSGNQIVWNIPYKHGYFMRDIISLEITSNSENNTLYYEVNDYNLKIITLGGINNDI